MSAASHVHNERRKGFGHPVIVGLFAAMVIAWQGQSDAGRFMGVCELLEAQKAHNGKTLTVAGPVARLHAVTILVGENCTGHIVAGGRQFSDSIVIMPSDIHPALSAFHISFNGLADIKGLHSLLDQAAQSNQQLMCELQGLFEGRSPDRLWDSKAQAPRGFGHLNMAPTQLVLKQTIRCWMRNNKALTGPYEPQVWKTPEGQH